MEIEFRDLINLSEVILSHTTAPHEPGIMCTVSATTLLYENQSKYPREVRWLDCKVAPPKAASGTNITVTLQNNIWDMCCVKDGDKQLLITSHRYDGVFAYNIKTDKWDWHATCKVPGAEKVDIEAITSDGHSHLFVADELNKCVQIFSISSGQYLGHVLASESNNLVAKWRVRWSNAVSSLIVAKMKNSYYHLNVTNISAQIGLPMKKIDGLTKNTSVNVLTNKKSGPSTKSDKLNVAGVSGSKDFSSKIKYDVTRNAKDTSLTSVKELANRSTRPATESLHNVVQQSKSAANKKQSAETASKIKREGNLFTVPDHQIILSITLL